jgi:adenosylcobinamide-GDP ribazoletransferase
VRSALAFLTILPVGRSAPFRGRATLLAFPAVGAVVGAAWWVAAGAGMRWWGPMVAAGLVLAVDLVLTGGLHLDAVADVGDALGSRRPAATVREVLADPRIGGIGAATLLVVGLLRFGALVQLLADAHLVMLVAVPVVGRAAMVTALATMPPTAGSLASALVEPARGWTWAVTGTTAIAVTAAAAAAGGGGLAAGLLAAVLALGMAAAAAAGWRRRYRAASGDLAGACGVLAETLALLVLVA